MHIHIACEDLFDMVISLTMDVVNPNIRGRQLDKINIIIAVYGPSTFVKNYLRCLYCLLIRLCFILSTKILNKLIRSPYGCVKTCCRNTPCWLCDLEVNLSRKISTKYCQLKFAFRRPVFLLSVCRKV